MTTPSLIAVFTYLFVIAANAMAGRKAATHRRPAVEALTWFAGAIYFALLAVMRLVEGEDRMRGSLRTILYEQGRYADRSAIQVVLTLIAIVVVGGLIWRMVHALRRHNSARRRCVLAMQSVILGSMGLYAVRLTSWHMTDALLYAGPVRLNWVLELAVVLSACILPLVYVRYLRSTEG